MKTSQAIQLVLDSGLYVANRDKCHKPVNEFFCHAVDDYFGQDIETAQSAKAAVLQQFKHGLGTLTNELKYSDKEYAWRVRRYGWNSACCFARRVQWLKNLIEKLQSEGN